MADEHVKEEIFMPSTIETIDGALTKLIKEDLNIFCTTPDGWKKVPVIWTSAERNFQNKDNKDLRDSNGSLIKPIITIERTSISKDKSKRGFVHGNIPDVNDPKGGTITIAREVNQDKTSNFANADAKRIYGDKNYRTRKPSGKTVYETVTIPLPNYIEVQYKISLYSEYQQQINEMISPFMLSGGPINHRLIKSQEGDHKYEAFIESDYSNQNNMSSLGAEERKFQTDITIKVLGYIIGAGPNDERPRIVRRQNFVEVKIPRERVITEDINEFIKKGFYRE